jgi:hypothetical protein
MKTISAPACTMMNKMVSDQLAKARLHIRYYSQNDIAEPIVDLLTSFSLSKQNFAYSFFQLSKILLTSFPLSQQILLTQQKFAD